MIFRVRFSCTILLFRIKNDSITRKYTPTATKVSFSSSRDGSAALFLYIFILDQRATATTLFALLRLRAGSSSSLFSSFAIHVLNDHWWRHGFSSFFFFNFLFISVLRHPDLIFAIDFVFHFLSPHFPRSSITTESL